jgi:hypothetical protein
VRNIDQLWVELGARQSSLNRLDRSPSRSLSLSVSPPFLPPPSHGTNPGLRDVTERRVQQPCGRAVRTAVAFVACHTPRTRPPPLSTVDVSSATPAYPRRRYRRMVWQRHGGHATTKERSIDLSRRMAGARMYLRCVYLLRRAMA